MIANLYMKIGVSPNIHKKKNGCLGFQVGWSWSSQWVSQYLKILKCRFSGPMVWPLNAERSWKKNMPTAVRSPRHGSLGIGSDLVEWGGVRIHVCVYIYTAFMELIDVVFFSWNISCYRLYIYIFCFLARTSTICIVVLLIQVWCTSVYTYRLYIQEFGAYVHKHTCV